MRELGIEVPDPATVRVSTWTKLQARVAPVERVLRAREAAEDDEVEGVYGAPTGDQETDRVLREIRMDESSHSMAVSEMRGGEASGVNVEVEHRLQRILSRERWHRTGGSWISDAIYGANDGLAAVFGIVAGVSGATGASRFVLTAGLAGALASSLSMGVGAWLATRSTNEMAHANLEQERREIARDPEAELEELSLFYQL